MECRNVWILKKADEETSTALIVFVSQGMKTGGKKDKEITLVIENHNIVTIT